MAQTWAELTEYEFPDLLPKLGTKSEPESWQYSNAYPKLLILWSDTYCIERVASFSDVSRISDCVK